MIGAVPTRPGCSYPFRSELVLRCKTQKYAGFVDFSEPAFCFTRPVKKTFLGTAATMVAS